MTDEQLTEAMVARIRANTSWLLAEEAAQIATAALAKVDEVYHRIPKDQEPITSVEFMGVKLPLPVPVYAIQEQPQ